MSKDKYQCILLKLIGGYSVYYRSNIFAQGCLFWRPFLKALKCQSNSVGIQNIVCLFKMFSSIQFNNTLGI